MTKKIFFVFIIIFNFNTLLADNIVYLDMNKVISTSIPGLSLIQQLNKIDEKNVKNYKEKIDELKKDDQKLLAQKNIISKTEFQKQVGELKKKIFAHNEKHKLNTNTLNNKKIKYTNELLKLINPILIKYSDEKKISLILKKKDLVIGKSNLDITDEIVKLINTQIKKINVK